MTSNSHRATAILLAASLLLPSCAVKQPSEPQLPYLTFSSVSLISETDLMQIVTPDTEIDRAREGFQSGVAAGGLGGMAAGAVCGPYWGLCAGGFGLIGMLAGGVAGLMYGFTGIAEDDAQALSRKLEVLESEWSIQSDLVGRVKHALPEAMFSAPETAQVHAILVLEGMEFVDSRQDLVLKLHARLTFSPNSADSEPLIGSKIFTARSHAADLDEWLSFDSDDLKREIGETLDLIAQDVSEVLSERWKP